MLVSYVILYRIEWKQLPLIWVFRNLVICWLKCPYMLLPFHCTFWIKLLRLPQQSAACLDSVESLSLGVRQNSNIVYTGVLEGVFVDDLPVVPTLHPVLLSVEVYKGQDKRKEHSWRERSYEQHPCKLAVGSSAKHASSVHKVCLRCGSCVRIFSHWPTTVLNVIVFGDLFELGKNQVIYEHLKVDFSLPYYVPLETGKKNYIFTCRIQCGMTVNYTKALFCALVMFKKKWALRQKGANQK